MNSAPFRLPADVLDELVGIVLTLGLDRTLLVAEIDPLYRGGLREYPNLRDQTYSDLYAFMRDGELLDGSVPLSIWLANLKKRVTNAAQAALVERARSIITPAPTEGNDRDEADHFLDRPKYPWSVREARQFFEILLSAYDRVEQIRGCLQSVERYPLREVVLTEGPDRAWRSALDAGARAGRLRALAETVMNDRQIAGYHGKLARLLPDVDPQRRG